MRHKQLKLSFLLLLGFGISVLQAQTMYVKNISETQTAHELRSIQKMSFGTGNMTITNTDNSNSVYALYSLRYLYFSDISTNINKLPIAYSGAPLVVYPNPVSAILSIDIEDVKTRIGTISILNLEGKVMKTHQVTETGIVMIDMSQLTPGIYLCRYANEKRIRIIKIIKQ